jgi:hypothetical protein
MWENVRNGWLVLAEPLRESLRDLAPIAGVIGGFQVLLFRQPLQDWIGIAVGVALVVLGLALFVVGLRMGLFPLGESLAEAFARKGSVGWLIAFALALGFGTTFAEPALIAIAAKAAELHGGIEDFGLVLRTTVALAVGVALVVGVLRILYGWSLPRLVIGGYLLVMVLTPLAPPAYVAIAYDSGAITTSTITVPLTTALGVGLAANLRGRNPLTDGFGMIALASLTPILAVLALGMVLA